MGVCTSLSAHRLVRFCGWAGGRTGTHDQAPRMCDMAARRDVTLAEELNYQLRWLPSSPPATDSDLVAVQDRGFNALQVWQPNSFKHAGHAASGPMHVCRRRRPSWALMGRVRPQGMLRRPPPLTASYDWHFETRMAGVRSLNGSTLTGETAWCRAGSDLTRPDDHGHFACRTGVSGSD